MNNAGIVRDGSIFNMTVEDFDAVHQGAPPRHLGRPASTPRCTGAQLNKETGEKVNGRIINTVSGAGLVGNFGQTNYAPAKAAIASLTQTLSLELYKIGVTVNAVGPAAATRITGTMPERPGRHRGRRRPRRRVEPHGPGGRRRRWSPGSPRTRPTT